MFYPARSLGLAVCAAVTLSCAPQPTVHAPPSPSPARPAASAPALPIAFTTATATLRDASGSRVGTVTFADSYAGVMIHGRVSDLGLGVHGIHIHSVGKCEPPFTSAGGHFNPDGRQHGYLNPRGPHFGDLPNITTPAAGALTFEYLLPGVTLKGRHGLLEGDGASIVIHASGDDYHTDPAGNSGARAACGVIVGR